MKKRIVSLFLVSILFLFTACSFETPSDPADKASYSDSKPSESKGDTKPSESKGDTKPSENKNDTKPSGNDQTPFAEVVVADTDECTIKITKAENNLIFGFGLSVQLENKSSEKNYMFSLSRAAINGVQCTPLWASEVVAGKKSNDTIYFLDSDLEDNGIVTYTDIELTFRVYDSGDWLAEDIINETVHVYPYGEENATQYVRESVPTDNIIIDNESVRVTVIGYEEDTIWGYQVKLFIVNKTGKEIMVSISDASVNGYMADPFFATSVSPNKCAFSSVTWFSSTLEENGISEVTELEFTMRVYDNGDWFADDFANETIRLTP